MERVSGCTLAILCTVNLFYIFLGGVCFHYLEYPNYVIERDSVLETTQTFLDQYPCVAREDLDSLVRLLGVDSGLEHITWENWDFSASIFFSTNVVSTIGYGKVAPKTVAGRVFCVFFATVGVPLFILTTGLLGDRAAGVVCRLDSCLDRGRLEGRRKVVKVTRTLLYAAAGALFFLLVTAGFLVAMGPLTYSDSLFYMYSILSTIGYGDFEPVTLANTEHVIFRVLVGFWIFLGLTWMFSMVGLLIDLFGIIITTRSDESKPVSECDENWLVSGGSLDSLNSDSSRATQYRSVLLR